jgi:hypothetical protein
VFNDSLAVFNDSPERSQTFHKTCKQSRTRAKETALERETT